MEFFEDHDNDEEFLLHGMVILLGFDQFTRPIHNRSVLFDDYGAHLVVRVVSFDVEWLWLRYAMMTPQPG